MRSALVLALILVAGCSAGTAEPTTTSTTSTTTTVATTTTVPETTTTTLPPECPVAPYDIGVLPARAALDRPATTDHVVLDPFTIIPGTSVKVWIDGEGEPVLALIRGSLPPEPWPGDRGEVTIDGARGIAGPFDDGRWVVAWFEEPGARCDEYMVVFFPPVEPAEVEATIASMDRTAG